ncbi:MAG: matrixin family metalloprotease [Planctomycetota bacterium]
MPPPVNNYSLAGDITFNTGRGFNINGSAYDLFAVASHEFGHSLGLYHGAVGSMMSSTYQGSLPALTNDDINGIRNIYSVDLARAKDSYDVAASNETFATASDLTATIDGASKAALVADLDLTTRTEVDWYKFTAPAGSATTLTVRAVATGLSMLDPKIEIYNSSNQLKATNNSATWGGTASTSYTIAAGQVWYVKVSSLDSAGQFKTGKYGLVLNMGVGADPTISYPNTQVANGNPLTAGGGQALAYTSETMVNTTTAGDQTTVDAKPSMAVDLNGNTVVVWASRNQDANNSWGVYAQRYNSSGVAQGSEFRVNTTLSGDQTSPTVAMAGNGDFVVAWASFNQDANNSWGVYAQQFSASGAAQGSEFKVNTTTVGDQTSPTAAMASNGDFVVAWSSYNQDATNSWGVYAQRFNAAGAAQGREFRANTTPTSDQKEPSAVMGVDGDFVITWSSFDQDAYRSWGVYAQRYDAAGVAQGSEFRINTTTVGDQKDSSGAIAANGTFVAVWTSSGLLGLSDRVYGQRFDVNGSPLEDEFIVDAKLFGDQKTPSVATDNYGGFIVTWASYGQDGSGWGIFGQQFGSSGDPHEDDFGINTTTAGDQVAPAAAMDRHGHLTIIWSGNGAGDSQGVFMGRYSINTDLYTSPDPDALVDIRGPIHLATDAHESQSLVAFWAAPNTPVVLAVANAVDFYFTHEEKREVDFIQVQHSDKKSIRDFFASLATSSTKEEGILGSLRVKS